MKAKFPKTITPNKISLEVSSRLKSVFGLKDSEFLSLLEIKKIAQQIVIIPVSKDKSSISFKALVAKGLLILLICKKPTKIISKTNAYTITPIRFINTATPMRPIFLYIITISQKQFVLLQPLYRKPNFYFTAKVSSFSLSLVIKNQTEAGIPIPQRAIQGAATAYAIIT